MTVRQAARHRTDAKPVTPLTDLADTASFSQAGKRGVALASAAGITLTAVVSAVASAETLPTVTPAAPSGDFVAHLEANDGSATLVSLDIDWDSGEEMGVKAEEPAPEPEPEPEPVVYAQPAAASRSIGTTTYDNNAGTYDNGGAAVAAAPAPAPAPAPVETYVPAASSSGIVGTALQFVGYPYVWGGASPAGFDCSGFTSYVYGLHGIGLPRTAAAQGWAGTTIPASAAQPGDLVVWTHGGHVAIYLGGGQIVHASTPATGVKISPLFGSYFFVRV